MRLRPRTTATNLLCACIGALLVLAFAPSVAMAQLTLEKDKDSPVVGEPVTFTAVGASECVGEYTFTVDDGPAHPPQASESFTTSFVTAGEHTVSVLWHRTGIGACGDLTAETDVSVRPALGASIEVTPDPPAPGRPATLSVITSGGSPLYGYEWDSDNDGAFDDGTTRTITTVFATAGPHVVRARVRDSASPPHETVATRTIEAVVPAPGAPAPPAPPPCTKRLAFALSEFTTDGCFTRTAAQPERWETRSAVKLNGIVFADSGQRFLITLPTASEPGGHFETTDTAIQIGSLTAYSGDIDWTLPAGKQGEEKTLRTVPMPPFARLYRLRVLGSVGVRLGWAADGTHYAVFPLNVELPAVFKPAPDPTSGSVTGTGTIRVDAGGPRYDGLKVTATDVWLGRIRVPEVCFSYVPAGGTAVSPCGAPSLGGRPYVECEEDVTTDRWDGNAILELPVEAKIRYAAFGGLADGRLSKLGGYADNIADLGVSLAPGVLLDRFGAGVCLTPPPLKVRGDMGIQALDGKLRVDGRFLYTDPFRNDPWSLEVGGEVTMADVSLGEGSVRFNAWGDVDFGVRADLDLFGAATFEGEAGGWVEPSRDQFNITGSGTGCIAGVICSDAYGLVSSAGIAGCIDAGSITVYEPSRPRTGPFGAGSISISLTPRVIALRAGFGHRWGTSGVDLLGNSCDFAPYAASRSARAAQTRLTQRIAPGAKAVALRIHGTDGPPKVIVRGPGGTTITSPATASALQRKGRFLLAENTTDGTTSVLLVKPAAGTWTVAAVPGAASKPTRVERSSYEAPASFAGRIRRRGERRELVVAYAAPAGADVRLVERGKNIARTIVPRLRGRACHGRRALPGGRPLRCARVRFRPSRGPGGVRRIQAVVTRKGIPLSRTDVASFRAPRETLPSRPGALRARRVKGDVVVAFPRSRGASRYSVTATLSDGRRLGFDLAASCRAVRITGVPSAVAAVVKVAGVRYDMRMGASRRISLAAGRRSAGPAGRLPRRVCT